MRMSLENLVKERIIGSIRPDKSLALKTFQLSRRDLGVARKVMEEGSSDWAFAIAYNSMLQAGRCLMFLKGYKPMGEFKHVAVVRFLEEAYSNEITARLISILDRMRKKRHTTLYDEPDAISEQEARNAIAWATEFAVKVEDVLKKEGVL